MSGSTYTWNITNFDIIPNINGLEYFVTRVYWVYVGIDVSGNTSNIQGYTEYDNIDPNNYTPYSSLTQDMVSKWLDNSNNTDNLQNIIDQQIQNIINPPTINLPLPW
jgi:hypothetical protein